MKKITILVTVLVLSLSLVACQAAEEKWSENMQLAMEAFGESLGELGNLSADSSEAEKSEIIDELDASWEELQAAAEAEGIELTGLERIMDELEQALRDLGSAEANLEAQEAAGEAQSDVLEAQSDFIQAQKEFIQTWSKAISEFLNTLFS